MDKELNPVNALLVYFSGALNAEFFGCSVVSICALVYVSLVFAFKFNADTTLVVPTTKAPLTVKSAAVAVPEKVGLSFGAFKSKAAGVAIAAKAVATLVVPTSKAPETVKAAAVAVPVKVGLAFGAFRSKLAIVAFSPKALITLVVPTSNVPETVKAAAVAVPEK